MAIDFIILLFLIFFVWRGAARGFLQSLIGPLAFSIATAAAFFYYQNTKNIWVSLSIGLLGPFLLHFALGFILRSFSCLTSSQVRPSFLSGLLGAMVTAAWGMSLILPVVYVLTFVPNVEQYTKNSITVETIKPLIKLIIPQVSKLNTVDSSLVVNSSSTNNPFQEIAQDPRMQAILKDPDITKAIEGKNYSAMLSNPKILEMAKDPAFVQKLLAAYAQTQKETIDKRPQTMDLKR